MRIIYNSLDNFLFVLGSLFIQVFFARYMEADEFGLFTLIFTVLAFAQMVSLSFFHEPFVLHSNSQNIEKSKQLLFFLVSRMLLSALPVFLFGFFLIYITNFKLSLIDYCLIFGSCLAAINFQFLRRFYHFMPLGLFGLYSSISYLVSLCLVLGLYLLFDVTINYKLAFLAVGISAFVASIFNLVVIGYQDGRSGNLWQFTDLGVLNFKMGLKVFSGNLSFFFISNMFILVLSIWGTMDEVGTLRMIFITLLPLNYIIASLNTIALATIKEKLALANSNRAVTYTINWFFMILLIGVIYGLFILEYFPSLFSIVFNKNISVDLVSLYLIAFLPLVSIMNLPFNLYLRARGRPDFVAIAALLSLIFLIIFSVSPIYFEVQDNIKWLLFSYFVSYVVGAFISLMMFRNLVK